jgi:hypothetical protein
MTRFLTAILLAFVAQPALAGDGPAGKDPPAADTAVAKPAESAKGKVPKPGDADYVPPPGFKTKKRGQLTVYCKRDRETGSRFTTEKCFDGNQMREYLLALEIQKRDIDRIRSTCATGSTCASQ